MFQSLYHDRQGVAVAPPTVPGGLLGVPAKGTIKKQKSIGMMSTVRVCLRACLRACVCLLHCAKPLGYLNLKGDSLFTLTKWILMKVIWRKLLSV